MNAKNRMRRTARVIVSLLAVLVAASLLGITGYDWACGVERWDIKTCADADAVNIDPSNPVPTSVSEMNTWTRPAVVPRYSRADAVEFTVYQLTATLIQYRRDPDGDYHLILQDADGTRLIAEIPDPNCATASFLYDYIANSRAEFDAVFNVTTTWHYPNVPVVVTGVGFWDYNHGQTGHAVNFVELHPVLDIQFP